MKALLGVALFLSSTISYSMTCHEALGATQNKTESEKLAYYREQLLNLPPAPKMSFIASLKQNYNSKFRFTDNDSSLKIPPEDFHLFQHGFGTQDLKTFFDGYRAEYHRISQEGTVDKSELYVREVDFTTLDDYYLDLDLSYDLKQGKFKLVSFTVFRVHDRVREGYEKLPLLTAEKMESLDNQLTPVIIRQADYPYSTAYKERGRVKGVQSTYREGEIVKILGRWYYADYLNLRPLSIFEATEIRVKGSTKQNTDLMSAGRWIFKALHEDKRGYRHITREFLPANLRTIDKLKDLVKYGRLLDLSLRLKSNQYSPIGVIPVLSFNPYSKKFYLSKERDQFDSNKSFINSRIKVTEAEITITDEQGVHKIPWSEIEEIVVSY